ncbi:MAG: CDGSH iron-sulfur domain-containing protein [Bacteroidetes bacterium]|nr:MAG: CDGSH iron-sulfur domain-containing protein [Bacteroidota bacterium]TAE70978.1 MAG: CDGSH iron-sulfur domain-containing protein [Bacteroidota bacterium]TAF93323.1 MAG: CDGSH iron-sulfur domain-containing protein [Bacteroidota bacterium]
MSYPKPAGNAPISCTLEADKVYAWCTCGLSEKQPFCDGKHKTDPECDLKSLKFTADASGTAWLCTCKLTKNPPYCDGSHKTLPNP